MRRSKPCTLSEVSRILDTTSLFTLTEACLRGRSEDQEGAHVSGHNRGTLGYSYVGGLEAAGKPKDTRTRAQRATMVRLTREAIAKYGLRLVLGHRDLSPDRDHDGVVEPFEWVKVCPCFNAAVEYGPLLGAKKAVRQKAIIARRKTRKRSRKKK